MISMEGGKVFFEYVSLAAGFRLRASGRNARVCSALVWRALGIRLIDFDAAAVSGGLRLVHDDRALASPSLDYARMIKDGLLFDDAEPLVTLLDQCRTLVARAAKSSG